MNVRELREALEGVDDELEVECDMVPDEFAPGSPSFARVSTWKTINGGVITTFVIGVED